METNVLPLLRILYSFKLSYLFSVFTQAVDFGCGISKPKSLFLSWFFTPSFRACVCVDKGSLKKGLGQTFSFLPWKRDCPSGKKPLVNAILRAVLKQSLGDFGISLNFLLSNTITQKYLKYLHFFCSQLCRVTLVTRTVLA